MEIWLQLSQLNSEFDTLSVMNADDLTCFRQWENSPTSHVIPIDSLVFPFSFHMFFTLVCSYCQSQPFLTYITYNFFLGWAEFFVLKMEAAVSWKTLMPVYWTACWGIPKDSNRDLYILLVYLFNDGAWGSVVVKALRY